MFKYVFFIVFFITSSFAQIDANLEIVKKANTLPKILISIASDSSEIATLNKIKNSLAKDLEISGHFELIKDESSITYEQIPDILALSNKGVDLYLNVSAKKILVVNILYLLNCLILIHKL